MHLLLSVFLTGLLTSVGYAGPAGRLTSTCSGECVESSRFMYKPGYRHMYHYKANADPSIGYKKVESMSLEARVGIQAITPCEFALTLHNVQLFGSSQSEEFAEAVTEKPLKFVFQNGRIEDICATERDPVWVVNFKKSILSHFQTQLQDMMEKNQVITETDAIGTCETNYEVTKTEDQIIIMKEKSIENCKNAAQTKGSLFSLGFEKLYKNAGKALQSSSSCRQVIVNGIFQEIDCDQRIIWDVSHTEHSLVAKTSLQYDGAVVATEPFHEFFTARSDLQHEDVNKKADFYNVEDILKSLTNSSEEVHRDTPRLFSKLVKGLGSLRYDYELTLLRDRTMNETTHKYFHDALLLVRTPDAMRMVVDMIKDNQIPELEANMWLNSISFNKDPSELMIVSLLPLLETKNQKAMLAISSLVNNFCNNNNDCEKETSVRTVLNNFDDYLSRNCERTVTTYNEVKVMIALKALGNAGRFTNGGHILRSCYREDHPIDIRLAAIDAWRRAPCSYNRDHLLDTYKDESQNTEVRIGAYLAVMKCPTENIIGIIKDRLTSESVNQVGSFVWSHLTNIQESAAPNKQLIRNLIGDDLLTKKFNSEALKLSRYYESSFILKEIETGGNAEADVVFSPESYLPRSARLNLTADIFGESVNLLEMGGRMEGFEYFIERFFSEYGYYPDSTISNILKTMRESKEKDVSGSVNTLTGSAKDPKGSMFMRFLGNELIYEHFTNNNLFDLRRPMDMIMEVFQKGGSEYAKSFDILDKTITVASITGFPVNVNLKSSGSVFLKMEGNFEFSGLSRINIFGDLRPSASIVKDSSLEMDLFVTKYGVTSKGTVHTSTAVRGKLATDGFRMIDFSLDTPKNEMQILDNGYEFYSFEDGMQKKMVQSYSYNDYVNCHSVTPIGALGAICVRREYNDFTFPTRTVYYKKLDTYTAINFKASQRNGEYHISFDTPGSRNNRKWYLDASINRDKVDILVDTPMGSASLDAILRSTGPGGFEGEGKAAINRDLSYSVKFSKNYTPDGYAFLIDVDKHLEKYFSFKYDRSYKDKTIEAKVGLYDYYCRAAVDYSKEFPTLKLSMYTKPFQLEGDFDLSYSRNHFRYNMIASKKMIYESEAKNYNSYIDLRRHEQGDVNVYVADVSLSLLSILLFTYDTKIYWESRVGKEGVMNNGTFRFYRDAEWNLENHLLYFTEGDTRKMDFKLSVNTHLGETHSIEKKVEYSNHHLKQNTAISALGYEGSSNVLIEFWKKIDMNAELSRHGYPLYSFRTDIHQETDGTWKLQTEMLGVKVDGAFLDKSVKWEKIDYSLHGSMTSLTNELFGRELRLSLMALRNRFVLSGDFEFPDRKKNYVFLLEASPSEFKFNTNYNRWILLHGKMNLEDEGKGFEFKTQIDKKDVLFAKALVSNRKVEASLKYDEKEYGFSTSLMDKGIKAGIRWSPTEVLSALVTYEIEDETSLLVSVETPFKGWKKQELHVIFSRSKSQHDAFAQVSVTWANDNHFSFTTKSKLENVPDMKRYTGQLKVTSTMKRFERLALDVDLIQGHKKIEGSAKGKFNDKKINGEIKFSKVQNRIEGHYAMETPAYGLFEGNFKILLLQDKPTFDLNVNYEGQSNFEIKASLDKMAGNIDFKMIAKSPLTMSLHINTRGIPIKDNFKLSLQFNSLYTNPFELNYAHTLKRNEGIIADADMTSFIYGGEKYKAHVDYNINHDESAISCSSYLTGPNINQRLKFSHIIPIVRGPFITNIEYSANLHSITAKVSGVFGSPSKFAIEIDTKSPSKFLNAIKLAASYELVEGARIYKANVGQGDYYTATLFVSFTKFDNFEIKINAESFFDFHLIHKSTGYVPLINNIDFHSKHFVYKHSLSEDPNLNLTLEIEGTWIPKMRYEGHPFPLLGLFFPGSNKRSATFSMEHEFLPWTPLTINMKADESFLIDIKGADVFNFNGLLSFKGRDFRSEFNLTGECTLFPILFELTHDRLKLLSFSLQFEEENEVQLKILKSHEEALLSTSLRLPIVMNHSFNGRLQYTNDERKYKLETSLTIMGDTYALSGSFDQTGLTGDIDIPAIKLSFSSYWQVQYDKGGKIEINYSCTGYPSGFITMDTDIIKKTVAVNAQHGGKKFTLDGNEVNNVYTFDVTTPVNGYENLKVILTLKTNEFITQFFKNNEESKLFVKWQFEMTQGEAIIQITCPYTKEAHLQLNYNAQNDAKTISVEGKLGDMTIQLNNEVNFSMNDGKIILFTIQSNSDKLSKLEFTVNLYKTGDSKKVTVDGILNDKSLHWYLQVGEGKLSFQTQTDFPSVKEYYITGEFSNLPELKEATIVVKSGDLVENYSIMLAHDGENVKLNIKTPIPVCEDISLAGVYKHANNECSLAGSYLLNGVRHEFSSSVKYTDASFDIELKTWPHNSITLVLKGDINVAQKYDLHLKFRETEYKVSTFTDLTSTKGRVEASIMLPISGFSDMKVNIEYKIDNEFEVDIDITREGNNDHFRATGKLRYSNLELDLITPFNGFEDIYISSYLADHTMYGPVLVGEPLKSFRGRFSVNKDYDYTYDTKIYDDKINIEFKDQGNSDNPHVIKFQYYLGSSEAFLKIRSTFKSLSHVDIIGSHMKHTDGMITFNVFIQINDDQLKLEGKVKLAHNDFVVALGAHSPSSGEKHYFSVYYKFQAVEKALGVIMDMPARKWELEIAADFDNHNPFKGAFFVKSNQIHHKLFGIKYHLLNSANEFDAMVTVIRNIHEKSLGLHGIFSEDRILMKVTTPIHGFETVSLDAKLDVEKYEGALNLVIGDWITELKGCFRIEDMNVLISTPFESLKIIDVAFQYLWEVSAKEMTLRFNLNDKLYKVFWKLPADPSITSIAINVVTPFKIIEKFEVLAHLNIDDLTDFLKLGFTFNEVKYFFSTGFQLSGCKRFWNWKLLTPFEEYRDTEFSSYLGANEHFEISMKRNGETNLLISGSSTDHDLDIETNFESVMNGRSKRSIDMMLSDHHVNKEGLIAKFNSLKIALKTPFDTVKTATLELTKSSRGGFTFNYKRNDYFVNLSVLQNDKKAGVDVSVKSSLPGWEYLAISGRLDKKELLGHITGQLNEKVVTVTGNGLLQDNVGHLSLKMTTPLKKYKNIVITYDYNRRRKDYKFQIKSGSPDLKALIEFRRQSLNIDIVIPHETQNTIIKGKLLVYKGNLVVKSRFPFIKTYSLNYELKLGRVIKVFMKIMRNDILRFNFKFERDLSRGHGMFQVEVLLFGNRSKFDYHRMGWKTLDVSFERNNKKISLEAKGEGNLPESGKITYTITNSFRRVPITVTGDISLDRTSSPKKLILKVQYPESRPIIFRVNYNINLGNIREGDFTINVDTLDKRYSIWKKFNMNWAMDSYPRGSYTVEIGPYKITGTGKFNLFDTDVTMTHNLPNLETIYYGWKFSKHDHSRDYYLKFGRETRYVMMKFKGDIIPGQKGDISGEFRASKYMKNDFKYTLTWKKDGDTLSGSGTFSLGNSHGTHTLHHFKRNAAERAAEFKWEANTNLPGRNHISLDGKYSVAKRLLDFKLQWDTDYIKINGKLDNMSWERSDNVITGHLPNYGKGALRIRHDFSNPLDKSVTATGSIGGKEVSYEAKWTRNEKFTKLNLNANVNSAIIGEAKLTLNYDVTDLNNAKCMLRYNRNNNKFVTLDWDRKVKETSLDHELVFTSSFPIHNVRVYRKVNWKNGLSYKSAIEINKKKKLTLVITVGSKKAEFSFKSDWPLLQDISAVAKYSFKPKSKSLSITYTREAIKVTFDFKLQIKKKRSGSLTMKLTSPYAIVKSLSIIGDWKNGKLHAAYKRNDIEVTIEGEADVKSSGKSTFELKFTPPGRDPVRVKLSYDVDDFKNGKGGDPKELFSLILQIAGESVSLSGSGYRHPGKIFLELAGESSLQKFRNFYLLLDSELNLSNREGHLVIVCNEFEFDMKNKFTQHSNGFNFESRISSTLTALPGVKFGIGRDKASVLLTLGIGSKEVTITFKGKDGFKKGFSGKITLPHREIDLAYDVEYSFEGDNLLKVRVRINHGQKNIELDIDYNSNGVRSRLSSPWTGHQRLRLKRSISDNGFEVEGGFNDYNCHLNLARFLDNGFEVKGEVLGRKFGADLYLNNQKTIGRFIVHTPFEFQESNIIGLKYNVNDQLKAELYLPWDTKANISVTNDEKLSIIVSASRGLDSYRLTTTIIAKRIVLEVAGDIETPYQPIPITFTFNAQSGRDNVYGSIFVDNLFGTHSVSFVGQNDRHIVSFNLKAKSRFLPEEFNVEFDQREPYRHFIVSSKPLNLIFNFRGEFRGDFYIRLACKIPNIIHNIDFEISHSKKLTFKLDLSILRNAYKLSISFDSGLRPGAIIGHVMLVGRNDLNLKIDVDVEQRDYLVSFNKILRFEFREYYHSNYPVLPFKLLLDIDTSILPKVSLKASFSHLKPLKANLTVIHNGKTYAASYSVVLPYLNLINNVRLEIYLPFSHSPYGFELKAYDELEVKGYKLQIMDGSKTQSHVLSMKVAGTTKTGKLHLLCSTFFLPGEGKASASLNYDFDQKAKVFMEVEFNRKNHNIYLFIDSKTTSILITAVSHYIPTGIAKLEAKVGEYSSTYGEAEMILSNAEKKISVKTNLKMEENDIDVLVLFYTPFEGYKKMDFGGSYKRADVTAVKLFALPLNFNFGSQFGFVDNAVKFDLHAKMDLPNWRNYSTQLAVSFPLNEFRPQIQASFGGDNYGLSFHSKREENNGSVGWSITTAPGNTTAVFDISYKTKAPYEIGFTIQPAFHFRPGSKWSTHVMFDSSFLVLSDAVMILY